MKRTNVVLDEALVCEGFKLTGIKTRRALIDHALRELIRRKNQLGLLSLKGKVQWDGNIEAMRKNRAA